MADMLQASGGKRPAPPRIDLTPMVDLAFLLITFFIFNTTLSRPAAMTAILPANSTDSSKVHLSGAVNLIATGEHLLYYEGDRPENAEPISYLQPDVLRQKLLGLRSTLLEREGNDEKLFVFIKPSDQSRFGHVVDLLDEMAICQIRRYTIADLNAEERRILP